MMIHSHGKQFTEPIFSQLARYRAELEQHPLLTAARKGELAENVIRQFAFQQFADSILWIPMLAQMKAKAVRSSRLRRAIEENIAHEAGIGGTSHVALAVTMMRSLGISSLVPFPTDVFVDSATTWISDEFAEFEEAAVAGWLLVAESLVPRMFEAVIPSIRALSGDIRYFEEHVEVDGDAHSVWMAESVEDVLEVYGPSCASAIEAGMVDAWVETLEVPDALWRQQCGSL